MSKTRAEKDQIIKDLNEKFDHYEFFYIADASGLNVAEMNELRKLCREKDITFQVAKNTLIKKAMEANDKDFEDLYEVLSGPSSIFFTEVSNAPAKIMNNFRKEKEKPALKAAYLEADLYIGDENLEKLAKLKSKEELIGDIVGLLQGPVQTVVQSLQSGGDKLSGLVKALAEKEEKGDSS